MGATLLLVVVVVVVVVAVCCRVTLTLARPRLHSHWFVHASQASWISEYLYSNMAAMMNSFSLAS
jgi:hypothetical protein